MCEKSLAKVSVENSINNLIIIDRYIPGSIIRSRILKFIKVNAKEIVKTKDWKKFVQCYPDLVTDVFVFLATQHPGEPPKKRSKVSNDNNEEEDSEDSDDDMYIPSNKVTRRT